MAIQLKASSIGLSKVKAPTAPLLNKPPSFSIISTSFGRSSPTRLTVSGALKTDDPVTENKGRRSANYTPSIWDYNSISAAFLASSHDYTEAKHGEEVEKLKTYMKGLIIGDMIDIDPLEKLEFIDVVQRLGLQYHFDAEIKHILGFIYDKSSIFDDDLYVTALRFRLLRQHGYTVHQDVFKKFMDSESGSFKESLSEDVKSMLSLYEASFLGQIDEYIVDEAMKFSTASLNKSTLQTTRMARMVEHALDMPIHWRPNRLEARWFIDEYKEKPCMDETLLRLAKLDYNMVQSVHQNAVAELIRWWVGLGLNKISFIRDRLVEHYLWSSIMVFEPQYKHHLIVNAKIASMVTIIDDCYDIYGTLDELEILTQFVNRWDITEVDRLPYEIRVCFLALFNTTNEIGLELTMEHGYNFIPYLHKMWKDQCNAYIKEARWYYNGIKPTFKEYLNNGFCNIGSLIMLLCCFLTTTTATDDINEENLDFLSQIPTIMHCPALIVRLNNDLATSSYELARGDNLKAIECYMAETGCSEEAARHHIKNLVRDTWKTMNEAALIKYPFKGPFVGGCLNLARASQCFYQYGDGHGLPNNETRQHIISVLIQPVPLP